MKLSLTASQYKIKNFASFRCRCEWSYIPKTMNAHIRTLGRSFCWCRIYIPFMCSEVASEEFCGWWYSCLLWRQTCTIVFQRSTTRVEIQLLTSRQRSHLGFVTFSMWKARVTIRCIIHDGARFSGGSVTRTRLHLASSLPLEITNKPWENYYNLSGKTRAPTIWATHLILLHKQFGRENPSIRLRHTKVLRCSFFLLNWRTARLHSSAWLL